jgi:hypothetical protein
MDRLQGWAGVSRRSKGEDGEGGGAVCSTTLGSGVVAQCSLCGGRHRVLSPHCPHWAAVPYTNTPLSVLPPIANIYVPRYAHKGLGLWERGVGVLLAGTGECNAVRQCAGPMTMPAWLPGCLLTHYVTCWSQVVTPLAPSTERGQLLWWARAWFCKRGSNATVTVARTREARGSSSWLVLLPVHLLDQPCSPWHTPVVVATHPQSLSRARSIARGLRCVCWRDVQHLGEGGSVGLKGETGAV